MAASIEIIRRLEHIMTEYITMGSKMNITVETLDLLRVLDRVIAEAEGEPQAAWSLESPHESFLEGLLEEIADHPNTVSEVIIREDGEQSYEPLSTATWLDTLYQLRERLERS